MMTLTRKKESISKEYKLYIIMYSLVMMANNTASYT